MSQVIFAYCLRIARASVEVADDNYREFNVL